MSRISALIAVVDAITIEFPLVHPHLATFDEKHEGKGLLTDNDKSAIAAAEAKRLRKAAKRLRDREADWRGQQRRLVCLSIK